MNKKTFISLFSTLLCLSHSVDSFALPKESQVVSGNAEFKQVDSRSMQVHTSDQAIINYSNFDIGKNEKVRFIQNSPSSCVLNRVQGSKGSEILGSLESNGKVFLVNSNGIYFGPDSSVNVGSFIASTLDIRDADFLHANYKFQLRDTSSSIKNEGLLNSAEGSIALLAPQIHNFGTISARAGSVVLTSGEHITLDFTGDGLIQFSITGTLKEALIEQLGDISASIVQLKIPAAKKAISEILNLDGIAEADLFIEENGVIKFAAAASTLASEILIEAANLEVKGSIDVSNSTSKGGVVHLLGRNILLEGTHIDASGKLGGGEVLIGGEYQGKGVTPWASKVIMDESSSILANALEIGDGGVVVLWSQDKTYFNGKIYSIGGETQGNGGVIETSSKGVLGIESGFVDTSASSGKYGDWLLDPSSVYIVDSSLPSGYGGSTNCQYSVKYCDCSCVCDPVFANNCCSGTTCCDKGTDTYCSYGCCGDVPAPTCNVNSSSIESASSNVTVQADSNIYLYANISMNNSVDITFSYCNSNTESYIYGPFDGNNLGTSCSITTNGGSVTIPNGVLNGSLTLQTSGGDVTLSNCSMLNSNTLSISAGSGDVTLSPIAPFLGSITIDNSGSTTLGVINIEEDFSQIGTGAVALGNSVIANSISFAGAITLSETTTFNSLTSITLSSSVNGTNAGSQGLTLIGTEEISIGNLGNSIALGAVNLTTSAAATIKSIITKASPITLSASSFTLGSNCSIDSTNGGGTGAGISISGDINATSTGGQSLTVNAGSTDLAINKIGNNTSLGALSLSANTINIADSTTVWKATSVNIQGQITSTASSLEVVNSGLFTLNSASDVSLVGSFAQTGSGAVQLGSDIGATSIFFASQITLSNTISLDSLGDLTLSSSVDGTTAGSQGLTLTGILAIEVGDIGISTALGQLSITTFDGSTIQNITTQAATIYLSAPSFILGTSSTIDSTNSGASGAEITIIGDINALTAGVESLVIDATGTSSAASITLYGSVGVDNALGSFTIRGDSTATSQVIVGESGSSELSIVANDTISITPSITLNTPFTVTSNTGSVTFENAVSGAQSISLSAAAVTLGGSLTTTGENANLSIFDSVSLSTSLAPISLTGSFTQTGDGPVSLGSDITATSISFNSPITLTNSATNLTAATGLTLSSTVDGACNLTLDGTFLSVILEAVFGGTTPLQSFTVTGNENSVNITGGGTAVDFIDMSSLSTITLYSNTSFITTNGAINLGNAALDAIESGGQSLTLNSGAFETDLGLAGFNSLLGAVTVDASLFNTLGIRTNGSEINITANSILEADSAVDTTNNGSITTGADISFIGSINSDSATANSLSITAGSGGLVTCSEDIGTITPLDSMTILSASNVSIQDVTVNNDINITPHITLENTLNTFTSNLNGDIYLGDIDGTANSAQSLRVSTGSGLVFLGVIGAGAVLNDVIVPTGESATIHSITVSGSIEIDIPIILAASSTLSTIGDGSAGSSITFKSINGTSVGGESFTVKTGVGDIAFTGQVGYLMAPGNLDITGNNIEFKTNLVSAAGTQSYHSPVTVAQNMVFRSLGDITFDATVEPLSVEPNLVLYPGGGTLTFAASIGDAPFGIVAVYNAGSFYAQDIVAKSLVVAGGLPSIYLEGDITLSGLGGIVLDSGPVNLGGDIAATHLWFRSYGQISSLGSSQAINISGYNPLAFEYINAIGGNIGSESSPININTTHQSNLGANYRADFEGEPFHGIFLSIPSNPPCIVTFNGITILDCNGITSPEENFNLIPKNLWYITWLYSSWDNLSNWEFFEQEPSNLGAGPRDLTMFYRKTLLYKSDPFIENSILDLKKAIPKDELVEWEFRVEFPEERIDLELNQ